MAPEGELASYTKRRSSRSRKVKVIFPVKTCIYASFSGRAWRMAKLRSVIVGATGLAGQQFIAALKEHPLFEIGGLAASARAGGKSYREALKSAAGMLGWFVPEPLPEAVAKMKVVDAAQLDAKDFEIAFSAVEADVARELEPKLARQIPVISTASAFRYE